MEFFSSKDLDEEHVDNNLSKSARLHTTDDYILSEFLDFPQFSPEVHSDSLYSLRTEADCWENDNQISESTECKNCINKMNDASLGSFMKFCCADPQPEVKSNRDCDVSFHEMSFSDDLSTLVFNTSTFDAFDYIEEAGSTINMTSRLVDSDSTCFQSGMLNSSSQCFDYAGGSAEDRSVFLGDSGLGNCRAEQLPVINCCNWSTDNMQMDLAASQNSRFKTVEIVEDEQANTHTENEGTLWSDWSLITQEDDESIPIGQPYGTTASSATTIMSVPSTIVDPFGSSQKNEYISHLDNASLLWTEVIDHKSENSKQKNIHVSELQPDTRSVGNTQLVTKNGQCVNQRAETESAFRKMTDISFISMNQQTELPVLGHMAIHLQNAHSHCYEVKNATPISTISGTVSNTTEHMCAKDEDKSSSENINSSHFSDLQASREHDVHRTASQSKTYMKVGKRGRYVTLPIKNVNELMVRDLLCISGNKEEMSIRDTTQDYRKNIRRTLQQKLKRLNHLKC